MTDEAKHRPGEGELRTRLTDEQYRITQEKATERPFTGQYLRNKDNGVYACIVCGTAVSSHATAFLITASFAAASTGRP